MRKSTKQITGYMRCVSTTVQDSTMEAVVCGIFDVTFDGKELKWQENQLLYRDNPIGEDKYKPVAFNSKVRFILITGKSYLNICQRFGIYPWHIGKEIV